MAILKKYLVLTLLLIFCMSGKGYAQKDTISTIILYDIEQLDNFGIDFTLGIKRDTDAWRAWANGTYQITITDFPTLNPQDHILEFLGSSQITYLNALAQPMNGYQMSYQVLNGRIAITVIGPDEYGNTVALSNIGDTLVLGRFRLRVKQDKILPTTARLDWVSPLQRYQAHAFKRSDDSITGGAQWHNANDNVEMDNSTTAVRYIADNPKVTPTNDIDFIARYKGRRSVELSWHTTDEFYNKGFILRRAVRPFEVTDPLDFSDTIGSYEAGLLNSSLQDAGLISKSIKGKGADYSFIDTVSQRGEEYVYELIDISAATTILAQNPGMHDRDTAAVIVPSSVISLAEAGPNPFKSSTTIRYYAEDDIYVTVKVTDIVGKEIEVLQTNVLVSQGSHTLQFNAAMYAANGLYNIIIIGTPIDDPSVEVSRATIKVQLLR